MKIHDKIDKFIYLLIAINVFAMVLESHESLRNLYSKSFYYFEFFSIILFTVEYFYRVLYSFKSNKKGIFKYIFSFYGVVDLLSILPFYLGSFINLDGRFIRILRLFRLIRIFKIGRYSSSLRLFIKAMTSVKNELTITLFLSLLIILFSASAIYYLEYDAQPDKFSSITESVWWATVSLATVGYGDVYPITLGGKIFATIISLVGIGIVAIPTGVISASFVEQINKQKKSSNIEL